MTYRIVHYNPLATEVPHWRDLRGRKMAMPYGWAFLCDAASELPHRETTIFLGNIAKKSARKRGRGVAGNSSNTYASELKAYLEYLQWLGVEWQDADPEVLFGYIDAQVGRRHWFSGVELQPETLARRVRRVIQAYKYTNLKGLSDVEIDVDELLAELWEAFDCISDGNQPANPTAGAIRHIGDDEWAAITTALGPLPSEIPTPADDDARKRRPSGRDRLAVELARFTGMRGGELAGLPLKPFEQAKIADADLGAWTIVRITDTKGGRPRNVYIPNKLVREAQHYIAHGRLHARKGGAKAGRRDPGTLLVNGAETGANAGRAMTAQQLSVMFRNTVRSALPTDPVTITDENGDREYRRPRFRLHDLRHTYALRLFHLLVDLKREPWDIIQGRLGHGSVEVTRSTYLDMSRTSEPYAADLLATGLDALIYA